MLIDKSVAAALMPQMGQVLYRVPHYLKVEGKKEPPRRGVVIAVHMKHLWYLVRYDADGLVECFKACGEKEG